MNEIREGIENRNKEKKRFRAVLKDNKAIVEDVEGINEFYESSYIGTRETDGEKQVLELLPIEALLLHERDRIFVFNDENKFSEIEISNAINQEIYDKIRDNLFSFEELLIYFSKWDKNLWQKYAVYNDLRKRGYYVRSGYGEGFEFRVFKRGADFRNESAKYLIYPIFEGTPINLTELDLITRTAMNDRKELVIAAVDRLSKPIYYFVKKFAPEEINK
jgi:tRNA-intron lyase